MLYTYLHFHNQCPRYAGEGIPGREKVMARGSIYGNFLRRSVGHVCVVIVGTHHNKVSSLLNEQGLISWIGMKIRNQGPLLNSLPYGDLGHGGGGMKGDLNPSKRPEVRDKTSRSRTNSFLITDGFRVKVQRSGETIPEGWTKGVTEEWKQTRAAGGKATKGFRHTDLVKAQMSVEQTGKKHWTNGVENKFQHESPGEGWWNGKTEATKRTLEEKVCPHCGATGKGGNMTRYHFDNCKKKHG
jgi:hypothetical protein